MVVMGYYHQMNTFSSQYVNLSISSNVVFFLDNEINMYSKKISDTLLNDPKYSKLWYAKQWLGTREKLNLSTDSCMSLQPQNNTRNKNDYEKLCPITGDIKICGNLSKFYFKVSFQLVKVCKW